MNLTDDELLAIIDETTAALGQILLTHRELAEGLLGQQQTERSQQKIDALRKKLTAEKERLTKLRRSQQRKTEAILLRLSVEDKNAITTTAKSLHLTATEYLVKCHQLVSEKVRRK